MTYEQFKAQYDMDKVVATVDDQTVTYGELFQQIELEELLSPGIKDFIVKDDTGVIDEFAKDMVVRKRVYQDAVAAGAKADEDELEAQVFEFTHTNEDITGEQKQQLTEFARFYMTITAYFNNMVTEQDKRAYYEEREHEYIKASVRHILIGFEGRTEAEAKTLADQLTQRIRQGEDMAALATEFTEDPGSKETGGLYENQPVGSWVDEFRQAAIDFEINVVGEPVKTEYGYHVMRVEDRKKYEFAEVEAMLTDILAQEKFKEVEGQFYDRVELTK